MITRGKDRGETGVISEVSGNDTGVVALVKRLSTKRLPTRGSPQHSQPGSAKPILACIRLTLMLMFFFSLSLSSTHICAGDEAGRESHGSGTQPRQEACEEDRHISRGHSKQGDANTPVECSAC